MYVWVIEYMYTKIYLTRKYVSNPRIPIFEICQTAESPYGKPESLLLRYQYFLRYVSLLNGALSDNILMSISQFLQYMSPFISM